MKKLLLALCGLIALLLVLGGVYVGANYAPDAPVDTLLPRWAPAPSQFAQIAGMRVHLRDEGPREDAAPLLLLHGTSASLHTWQGWAEALRGERRVIRVDMPGFGLTGPSPDGQYAIEDYVRFAIAVLDSLGVQQAIVAGNSLGGHIAWEMAVAHPARVKALVLVDAGGYALAAKSMPIGFRIARTPVLNTFMQVTLPRSMVEDSVRDVYGDTTKVTPELVDRYYDLTRRAGNRAALVKRFEHMPSGERAHLIKTLKQPTLILWGSEDRLITPDRADMFHRDIAGSQLVVFPGLGHVPHEEDAAATVAATQAFLTSLR